MGDEIGLQQIWRDQQERLLAAFPHEIRILREKTIEITGLVSTCFVAHNLYLLACTWDHSLTGVSEKLLHILSYLRIILYFPRLHGWIEHRRLYRNMRNLPTPQLLQQRLQQAQIWEQPGSKFLGRRFYLWMFLLPCLINCGATETELSTRLWRHWKLYMLWWFVVSRIGIAFFGLWLQSSSFINRGVSDGVIASATKVIRFNVNEPWAGFGAPECGICLAEYEPNVAIRVLPCSHHFHPSCVDAWLKRYRNNCPFCQGSLEPKVE